MSGNLYMLREPHGSHALGKPSNCGPHLSACFIRRYLFICSFISAFCCRSIVTTAELFPGLISGEQCRGLRAEGFIGERRPATLRFKVGSWFYHRVKPLLNRGGPPVISVGQFPALAYRPPAVPPRPADYPAGSVYPAPLSAHSESPSMRRF